ncbi:MAG: hypothetical protein R6U21_03670 [Thermoplasmatota archaeon]
MMGFLFNKVCNGFEYYVDAIAILLYIEYNNILYGVEIVSTLKEKSAKL